jgi:hypothetical protein
VNEEAQDDGAGKKDHSAKLYIGTDTNEPITSGLRVTHAQPGSLSVGSLKKTP